MRDHRRRAVWGEIFNVSHQDSTECNCRAIVHEDRLMIIRELATVLDILNWRRVFDCARWFGHVLAKLAYWHILTYWRHVFSTWLLYVSRTLVDFLNTGGIATVRHPSYSPGLDPCDFWVSSELNFPLWKWKFKNNNQGISGLERAREKWSGVRVQKVAGTMAKIYWN